MVLKVSIYEKVKVKLSMVGEKILKEKYGEKRYKKIIENKKDEEGYFEYPIISLMEDFGQHLHGLILPFGNVMFIEND